MATVQENYSVSFSMLLQKW